MNLAELVQHLRCNLLRDTAKPQLWSDPELVRYLNQALNEFCHRTHYIIDDETAKYTVITTEAGKAVYPLHADVLKVYAVGIAEYDSEDPPNLTNYTPLRSGTRNQVRRSFLSGRPSCYTAQTRTSALRLSPIPDAAYTIEMTVARKPQREMSKGTDTPEIDSEYHLGLCDYAAYRALLSNDPDAGNEDAANKFFNSWGLYIRDAKRNIAYERSGDFPQARNSWTGKRSQI